MIRQHLMFDADDTLWENNRVFEEVISEFVAWLEHPALDEAAIRAVLEDVERANVAVRGYGTKAFAANLIDTFYRLGHRTLPKQETAAAVAEFVRRLTWEELDLIAGVEDTLRELEGRHDLLLVTKGDVEEQQRKIDVSGLAGWFRHILIVDEKDESTYARVLRELSLAPARTWMIGNSPRSDVLAPLAAGLRSVYISHPHTRSFEQGDVPVNDPRILRLGRFDELVNHF